MKDHDYEATVETEHGTFTFSGDRPRVVSAQAAKMPVVMHTRQVHGRIDLSTDIQNYLENIAHEESQKKKKENTRNYWTTR